MVLRCASAVEAAVEAAARLGVQACQLVEAGRSEALKLLAAEAVMWEVAALPGVRTYSEEVLVAPVYPKNLVSLMMSACELVSAL